MPGICTNAMRQSVRPRLSDLRKASAQGNASGENPAALIRLMVASRTDSSSSTIEIIVLFAISALVIMIQFSDAHRRCHWTLGRPNCTKGRVDWTKGSARLYFGVVGYEF